MGDEWVLDESNKNKVSKLIGELISKYSHIIDIADWNDDTTESKKMDYNHGGFACGAGNLSWTITEKGNIRPCVFLPEEKFTTGNIFTDNLEKLLKKEHIEGLHRTLEMWEEELNFEKHSTKDICPVMSNYLESFEEYFKNK